MAGLYSWAALRARERLLDLLAGVSLLLLDQVETQTGAARVLV
jgi:hypothetical protein